MRFSNTIITICLIALATGEQLNIKPDEEKVNLSPKTGYGINRKTFELSTCKGCKMQIHCLFGRGSCRTSSIMINDGNELITYCPEDDRFLRTSYGNKMTVTFENVGNKLLSFCDVIATRPYLDVPEPFVDSREHGLIRKGLKKTNCRCGWTNKSPTRIVGGNRATVNEYSFIALLLLEYKMFPYCGGSIITERHILTAAHCTYGIDESIIVAVGEHDIASRSESPYTRLHGIRRILEHPSYSRKSNIADIALLEVVTPIVFNEVVGPVCLPHAQENLVGQYVKVMGWGNILDKSEGGDASNTLRKVNLRVIDPEVCRALYKIDTTLKTQICTYNNNKDSCEGDSGGPLVYLNTTTNTYYQVALVSFGRKCGGTDPAVNTDVAYFMKWIQRQIDRPFNPVNICQ